MACIGATSSILSRLRPDSGGKISEEIVGGLLCHAIDEALSELGELAADLRFDVEDNSVPPSLLASETLAPPLANPATPPSPSPEIR
jgi:hypothetical protein